jgi:hypothetical protein
VWEICVVSIDLMIDVVFCLPESSVKASEVCLNNHVDNVSRWLKNKAYEKGLGPFRMASV